MSINKPSTPEVHKPHKILIRDNNGDTALRLMTNIIDFAFIEDIRLNQDNFIIQMSGMQGSIGIPNLTVKDLESATAAVLHELALEDLYLLERFLIINPAIANKVILLHSPKKVIEISDAIYRLQSKGVHIMFKDQKGYSPEKVSNIVLGIRES